MVVGDCMFSNCFTFCRHIEHHSTTFGTVLNYLSLRILGVDKNHEKLILARNFLTQNGGPLLCPQWGKLYMCTLGVMDWGAIDPVPPELWYVAY